MAGELGRMCQTVLEAKSPDGASRHVALRLPFTLASDHFAATSLGFRDRAFFERPNPERFFPWWEEGLTAQTLKNLALSKMWGETFWQPHNGDVDRKNAKTDQKLIDLAQARGAEFAADEGVDDTAALVRGEPSDIEGGDGRIGYWRQDIWFGAPGGWAVRLPAFYRLEISEGGRLCSMRYGDRAVYIRTITFKTALADLEWPTEKQEGCTEILRFETDQYRAVVHSPANEDNQTERLWRAEYHARNGAAWIGIAFRDKEGAAWAEKALRSVRSVFPLGVAIEPLS